MDNSEVVTQSTHTTHTTVTTTTTSPTVDIGFSLDYLKSVQGILKVVEIVSNQNKFCTMYFFNPRRFRAFFMEVLSR